MTQPLISSSNAKPRLLQDICKVLGTYVILAGKLIRLSTGFAAVWSYQRLQACWMMIDRLSFCIVYGTKRKDEDVQESNISNSNS
jgi:hypothetical protein